MFIRKTDLTFLRNFLQFIRFNDTIPSLILNCQNHCPGNISNQTINLNVKLNIGYIVSHNIFKRDIKS